MTWGLLGARSLGAAGCAREARGGEGGAATEAAPRVIAHRGASAHAPEHTLAAYRLGLEYGADFIEPDLQVTRDRQLVAVHDLTLERTTDVEEVFPDRYREDMEDGRAVRRWYVSDFTLEEIRSLDAGSWFGPEFAAERVPTFAEVVETARGRADLIPETKAPEIYGSIGISMERLLLDELQRLGLDRKDANPATPVVVQSFSRESLETLRTLGTDLPLVFLFSGADAAAWLTAEGLAPVRTFADGIGPAKNLLLEHPDAVTLAHAVGLTVTPWTFQSLGPRVVCLGRGRDGTLLP